MHLCQKNVFAIFVFVWIAKKTDKCFVWSYISDKKMYLLYLSSFGKQTIWLYIFGNGIERNLDSKAIQSYVNKKRVWWNASLTNDEKSDEIEVKTRRSRLIIAFPIFGWVASIFDRQWNRKLVMEQRKGLMKERLTNALFNYVSLPRECACCIYPYLGSKRDY